ncbi:MAG: Asp-tRNA(Asn)/Glu-tRNA(Gln) amidotransferase subunit GatC [Planctomycetes bacterium]|nr:Asp-tRNA(Asn)/Glu-tRNA(Gln) amidotransferase subunit GatC [Planctomycetota bacterium]
MSLTDAEVRKLAYLARLELSDDEVAMVRPQLDRILEFVESLSGLDTENVEPMTTALDVDNRWRPDALVSGLSNAQALENAPAHDEECFLVPAVLGAAATRK